MDDLSDLVQGEDRPRVANTGEEFLLSEFSNARYFHQADTAISDRRIDTLFTLASAIGAGLVILSQTHFSRVVFLYLAVGSCVGLLIIGLPTFTQSIATDNLAVDYIRAINRIRAYFAERSPEIIPYLLLPTYSRHPRYGRLSSNRRIVTIINSFTSGAFVLLLSLIARQLSSPDPLALVLGMAGFVVMYTLHVIYADKQYRTASRKANQDGTTSRYQSLRDMERDLRAVHATAPTAHTQQQEPVAPGHERDGPPSDKTVDH